jgi:hypothetical protein
MYVSRHRSSSADRNIFSYVLNVLIEGSEASRVVNLHFTQHSFAFVYISADATKTRGFGSRTRSERCCIWPDLNLMVYQYGSI